MFYSLLAALLWFLFMFLWICKICLNLELFSKGVGYFVVNHSNFSFGAQMTKLSVWDLVEIAVDNLESCSSKVGENIILSQESGESTTTASNSISGGRDKSKLWFPFAEGIPFAATLWMGAEGFHMTVNGRHISSFQYRQVWMPSPIVIPNGLKSMKIFNFTTNLKDFSMYCFRSVVLGMSRIRIDCFPLNILLSI